MLQIKLSPEERDEKYYTLQVVFQHFLGIPIDIQFVTSDSPEKEIEISSIHPQGGPKKLSIPELYFTSLHGSWPRIKEEFCKYSFEGKDSQPIPLVFSKQNKKWKKFPLDLLGSIYFLLSNSEEQYNSKRDEFNRFLAKDSLLKKHGLLLRPIVNEYIALFSQYLLDHFPGLKLKTHRYEFHFFFGYGYAFSITSL